MGSSVYGTVVFGVELNPELVAKLKSKAREEGILVDEWLESDEYELGEWLWGRTGGISVHNGGDDPQYVLGFELATTDCWSLGVFDCEFAEKLDDMTAAFTGLDPSISPRLYLVSCYA